MHCAPSHIYSLFIVMIHYYSVIARCPLEVDANTVTVDRKEVESDWIVIFAFASIHHQDSSL